MTEEEQTLIHHIVNYVSKHPDRLRIVFASVDAGLEENRKEAARRKGLLATGLHSAIIAMRQRRRGPCLDAAIGHVIAALPEANLPPTAADFLKARQTANGKTLA